MDSLSAYDSGASSALRRQSPITVQPINGDEPNSYMPTCPNGLEALARLDQLLIRQVVEMFEAFLGIETSNRYIITDSTGRTLYWALEVTGCCTRCVMGASRAFEIRIMDSNRNQVLHVRRPKSCGYYLCPCLYQIAEVFDSSYQMVGMVREIGSWWRPTFKVIDESGSTALIIKGPLYCACNCNCCEDISFQVFTNDGQQVGVIARKWSGMARELFTDADFFGMSFPVELDVKLKATLIGALFLIDFMIFER